MTQEAVNRAQLIIDAVKNELALGTKHYSKKSNKPLETPLEIITAMRDNDLIIEPHPLRRYWRVSYDTRS